MVFQLIVVSFWWQILLGLVVIFIGLTLVSTFYFDKLCKDDLPHYRIQYFCALAYFAFKRSRTSGTDELNGIIKATIVTEALSHYLENRDPKKLFYDCICFAIIYKETKIFKENLAFDIKRAIQSNSEFIQFFYEDMFNPNTKIQLKYFNESLQTNLVPENLSLIDIETKYMPECLEYVKNISLSADYLLTPYLLKILLTRYRDRHDAEEFHCVQCFSLIILLNFVLKDKHRIGSALQSSPVLLFEVSKHFLNFAESIYNQTKLEIEENDTIPKMIHKFLFENQGTNFIFTNIPSKIKSHFSNGGIMKALHDLLLQQCV